MTAENAVFYRRMLAVGLSGAYLRDVERALDEAEPLTDLLLELAFCLSDTDKTISVLDHYLENREPNEEIVYTMLLAELRSLYTSKSISLQRAAEALIAILKCDQLYWEEPWKELSELVYSYEEVEDGFWTMDDFLQDVHNILCSKGEGGLS